MSLKEFVIKPDPADPAYAFHPDTGQRFVRCWLAEIRESSDFQDWKIIATGSEQKCRVAAADVPGAVVEEIHPPSGDYRQDPDDRCWHEIREQGAGNGR